MTTAPRVGATHSRSDASPTCCTACLRSAHPHTPSDYPDTLAARANAVVSSGGPGDGAEQEEEGDEETGDSEKKTTKKAK